MIVYLESSVRIQVLDDSSRARRCLDAGTRFESIVGYVAEAIHTYEPTDGYCNYLAPPGKWMRECMSLRGGESWLTVRSPTWCFGMLSVHCQKPPCLMEMRLFASPQASRGDRFALSINIDRISCSLTCLAPCARAAMPACGMPGRYLEPRIPQRSAFRIALLARLRAFGVGLEYSSCTLFFACGSLVRSRRRPLC